MLFWSISVWVNFVHWITINLYWYSVKGKSSNLWWNLLSIFVHSTSFHFRKKKHILLFDNCVAVLLFFRFIESWEDIWVALRLRFGLIYMCIIYTVYCIFLFLPITVAPSCGFIVCFFVQSIFLYFFIWFFWVFVQPIQVSVFFQFCIESLNLRQRRS